MGCHRLTTTDRESIPNLYSKWTMPCIGCGISRWGPWSCWGLAVLTDVRGWDILPKFLRLELRC